MQQLKVFLKTQRGKKSPVNLGISNFTTKFLHIQKNRHEGIMFMMSFTQYLSLVKSIPEPVSLAINDDRSIKMKNDSKEAPYVEKRCVLDFPRRVVAL